MVSVVLAGGPLAPVTAQQASIATRMGILVREGPAPADLVFDALIGYGVRGDPRGRTAELIGWAPLARDRCSPLTGRAAWTWIPVGRGRRACELTRL